MTIKIHESGLPNAPAIVFLHGLGVSSWMWHDQIEVLKQRYHCLAIDLPGSGESHQSHWESFEVVATQVANIIRDKVRDGRAHVVGLSLGGYTALHLLAQHPDVVNQMIVSGISLAPMMHPKVRQPAANAIPWLLKRKLLVNLGIKMMQLTGEAADLTRRDMGLLSAEMVKRIYLDVLNYSGSDISEESASRLLIVAGGKEARAVMKSLDIAIQKYRSAAVAIAPDAHHGWTGERPELFTAMIEAWAEKKSLPSDLNVLHLPSQSLSETRFQAA